MLKNNRRIKMEIFKDELLEIGYDVFVIILIGFLFYIQLLHRLEYIPIHLIIIMIILLIPNIMHIEKNLTNIIKVCRYVKQYFKEEERIEQNIMSFWDLIE